MKKTISVLFLLIAVFIFTYSCSNQEYANSGTFTINFGTPNISRNILTGTNGIPENFDPANYVFDFTIKLTNGPGPDQIVNNASAHYEPGVARLQTFTVAPGQWTITVEAYITEEFGWADSNGNSGTTIERYLAAIGTRTVTITSGSNGTISIQMIPVEGEPKEPEPLSGYIVNNPSDNGSIPGTLRYYFDNIESMEHFFIYIDLPQGNRTIAFNSPIEINKSVQIDAVNNVTFVRGNDSNDGGNFIDAFFNLNGYNDEIWVTLYTSNNAEFVIDGSLPSGDISSSALIVVNNNTELAMEGNFILTGNNNSDTNSDMPGGAVHVNGGTFRMFNSVVISGNEAENGGGVYIASGAFNMYGGEIGDNKASINGGGVYVDSGAFNMSDGTILGNKALGAFAYAPATPVKNWEGGGGVYISYFGNFSKISGTIFGDSSSDNANEASSKFGHAVLWQGNDGSSVHNSGSDTRIRNSTADENMGTANSSEFWEIPPEPVP